MKTLKRRLDTTADVATVDLQPEHDLLRRSILDSFPPLAIESKAKLFESYGGRIKLLERRTIELNTLLGVIDKANFDDPSLINLQVKNLAGAELAVRPIDEIVRVMDRDLADNAKTLAVKTVSEFENRVKRRRMGLIDWHSDEVVRYCHHRHTFWNREETKGLEVFRVDMRRISTTFYDLIDAKEHPVIDRSVRRPHRVDQLIAQVPEWLRGELKIVTGTQIRDLPIETDEEKVRTLIRRIPAPTPPKPPAIPPAYRHGVPAVYQRSQRQESGLSAQQMSLLQDIGAGTLATVGIGVAGYGTYYAASAAITALAPLVVPALGTALAIMFPIALIYGLCVLDPALTLGPYVLDAWQPNDR